MEMLRVDDGREGEIMKKFLKLFDIETRKIFQPSPAAPDFFDISLYFFSPTGGQLIKDHGRLKWKGTMADCDGVTAPGGLTGMS